MKIGVHDLLPIMEGQTVQERYDLTIDFVKEMDKIGVDRYWASEHHGMPTVASSTPEILLAYLAGITDNIRLGTGGTMILNYSPLKVAEVFKMLTSLAPDRIDLGIGRAPGGSNLDILALSQGKSVDFDNLYEKAQVILDYLVDKTPEGIYGRTQAVPAHTETVAEPWMLGSSGQSAIKTAEMGLGYSFAKFFGVETDEAVFKAYKDRFVPSEFFQEPKVMVSYNIVVADSQEEADYHAKPVEYSMANHNQVQIMDPENIKDSPFSSSVQSAVDHSYEKRFMIKGTPEKVERILSEEIETYGIDEIMAYSPIFDPQARIDSYKLLNGIFK